MRFQNGDIVRIAKGSPHYTSERINPRDVDGKIIGIDDGDENPHNIRVNWDNGGSNMYRESDLRLRSREQIAEPMRLTGSMHYPTGDYEPTTFDDIPW